MYPHTPYFRGSAPGIPPYESRVPLFFGFGAPLVGGLLGGFLGSAIFNYPRPYYPHHHRLLHHLMAADIHHIIKRKE